MEVEGEEGKRERKEESGKFKKTLEIESSIFHEATVIRSPNVS